MPRKSAASTTAASEGIPTSPTTTHDQTINGDASLLSAAGESSTTAKAPRTSTGKHEADSLGIDDLLLPRTLTSRLARGILPPNTSIQKDALLALTKSATVFISHLASTANEQSTKKTVAPQDVLKALQEMELGQLMELGQVGEDGRAGGRLERELEMWESAVKGKRKGYREKVKARESTGGEGDEEGEEGGEPAVKRVRMDDEGSHDGDGSMPRPHMSLNNVGRTNGGDEAEQDTKYRHEQQGSSPEEQAEEDEDEQDEADGDETESVPDDEEEEEEQPEGSVDGDDYGPDEQLRHEALINGNGAVDMGGTDDESD